MIVPDISEKDLRQLVDEAFTYGEILKRLGIKSSFAHLLSLQNKLLLFHIDTNHLELTTPYSECELRGYVTNSKSLAEIAKTLGKAENYWKRLAFDIRRWRIDVSHFHGREHHNLVDDPMKHKQIPLTLVFSNQIYLKSSFLKNRLFREGYKTPICEVCARTEHGGSSIRFELNHKNGNKFDNQLKNLEILCPNCHSLTPTFAGGNKRRLFADEAIIDAVAKCTSISATLSYLWSNASGCGARLARLRADIARLCLDTSHWEKPFSINPAGRDYRRDYKTVEHVLELLTQNSHIKTAKIKEYLIRVGLKMAKCECCEISNWDGQKLAFTLDHINGIKNDHRLENLRVLCFICHSRTANYKGKNIPSAKRGLAKPYSKSRPGGDCIHYEPKLA